MIASYVDGHGHEHAYDVAGLDDLEALVREARCSVLLEHENGSNLALSGGEAGAFVVWTDPLGQVYSWHGDRQVALACVRTYLETGWPGTEEVRFTHDGT